MGPVISPLAVPPAYLPEETYDQDDAEWQRDREYEDDVEGEAGPTGEDSGPDPERELLNFTLEKAGRRLRVDGGQFILDAPEHIEAVWGTDDQVVWAKGEPLLICGPAGVGKTTLAQQLTLARCGLAPDLLGFAVAPEQRRVLYLASDRPSQAQRSFRRMVGEDDRQELDERLTIWRGPLPYLITKRPEMLVAMAEAFDAGTIIIDSLKDVAIKLSGDEEGALVNQSLQMVVAAGVEVAALHHQRKGQQGLVKPRALADVFGSTWITAGAGSVVLIWGEPGDAVVELSHLKQPLEDVGPLTLLHDHGAGRTTVQGAVDLWDVVRTSNGLTAEGAARAIFGVDGVERNQVEKARRKLDALVKKASIHKEPAGKDATGRQQPARYYVVAASQAVAG